MQIWSESRGLGGALNRVWAPVCMLPSLRAPGPASSVVALPAPFRGGTAVGDALWLCVDALQPGWTGEVVGRALQKDYSSLFWMPEHREAGPPYPQRHTQPASLSMSISWLQNSTEGSFLCLHVWLALPGSGSAGSPGGSRPGQEGNGPCHLFSSSLGPVGFFGPLACGGRSSTTRD